MIDVVEVEEDLTLNDYAANAQLMRPVQELRSVAEALRPKIGDRKIWMVNSTARGGGVAEMMPRMIAILRELEVRVDWLTITPHDEAFFPLTKKIHNLIHGAPVGAITEEDGKLYDEVSQRLADELAPRLGDDDILVVHDPQPAGMGALLEEAKPSLVTIWRCHIGLDEDTPETNTAWSFLEPRISIYDHAVFSAPEYIPPFLTGRSTVIAPAIDPLTPKNRPLSAHDLVGILCNAGLMPDRHPVEGPAFEHPAQRLNADGEFGSALGVDDIGLLYRPIVTQISRWDRLKGFKPLLDGFALLKRSLDRIEGLDDHERRTLTLVRLVLAGPEPAAVQDDPEAKEVLAELIGAYRALEPEIQRDVALLSLPMASREQNASMVNALQRSSSIVVQNSIREGFGLTATEAMWKRVPVLGSTACGLRQQIRDEVDGRLNPSAEDPHMIAELLLEMLRTPDRLELWGRHGQRRVSDEFLVFAQLRRWLGLFGRAKGGTVGRPSASSIPPE